MQAKGHLPWERAFIDLAVKRRSHAGGVRQAVERSHRESARCPTGKGFRNRENPACWRGHLDQLLPKRKRLSRGHHTALPHDAVPVFMASLGERRAWRRAQARSWAPVGPQIGLDKAVWTVPASRMKGAVNTACRCRRRRWKSSLRFMARAAQTRILWRVSRRAAVDDQNYRVFHRIRTLSCENYASAVFQ